MSEKHTQNNETKQPCTTRPRNTTLTHQTTPTFPESFNLKILICRPTVSLGIYAGNIWFSATKTTLDLRKNMYSAPKDTPHKYFQKKTMRKKIIRSLWGLSIAPFCYAKENEHSEHNYVAAGGGAQGCCDRFVRARV